MILVSSTWHLPFHSAMASHSPQNYSPRPGSPMCYHDVSLKNDQKIIQTNRPLPSFRDTMISPARNLSSPSKVQRHQQLVESKLHRHPLDGALGGVHP